MSKKSYMSLLKEAIAEFDTSKTVDVKGPMLDPILSWRGDGEVPTHKDAASILERYYFNEKMDRKVSTLESDFENDMGTDLKGKSMDHAEGAGTEQAGTDDADTMAGIKKDIEEDITEAEDMKNDGDDDEDDKDEMAMENAIIEKLIAEMEDENEDEEDEKETVKEEKEAKGPEEHATGAGTEQAGTGDAEGQIPDRKDIHDELVKPKHYTENEQIEEALAQLEMELMEADTDEDEDEDKDLDVDKKMNETASAVPGGPSPHKTGEDWEDDERYYTEAFNIFKEAILEDEDMDDDDDMEDDEEVEMESKKAKTKK